LILSDNSREALDGDSNDLVVALGTAVTGWFEATALTATFKWLRTNQLVRYNAIYLTGSLAAGALGYAFHFATGRLLGPSQYAVVASAVAALYLINLPSQVVQTVTARFTSIAAGRGNLGNIPGLLVQLTGLSMVVGAPIAIGLIVFSAPLSSYLQISNQRVLYVLAAASLVVLALSATRGALIGLSRFVALSLNTVLDMTLRVISSVGLVLAGLGPIGATIALVFGPAVALVQSLALFRGLRAQVSGNRAALSDVGTYAALTTVAQIGTTYLYNSDVILSKHYLVAQDAGIYAAASVLGRVAFFLGLTIAQVMFPQVATLHAKDEPHFHVVDLSLAMLVAVVVFLVCIYAAVPGLVVLPFGSAFNPVRQFLWPFALALGLLAISNLIITFFLSTGSARFVLPLIGACVLEPLLIVLHHNDPGAILQMVVITMSCLTVALVGLYGVDRIPSLRQAKAHV